MKLKVGDKIEDWSYTVKQENLVDWSNFLNDPNPIHLNQSKVKELGLGNNCINQGPANIAYILNSINYNFPNCKILNLNNKLKGNVFSGDNVNITGKIIDLKNVNNLIILTLKLELDTQRANSLLISIAEISLSKI